jgi:hypothetical protein
VLHTVRPSTARAHARSAQDDDAQTTPVILSTAPERGEGATSKDARYRRGNAQANVTNASR